jgi:hypothetical protein
VPEYVTPRIAPQLERRAIDPSLLGIGHVGDRNGQKFEGNVSFMRSATATRSSRWAKLLVQQTDMHLVAGPTRAPVRFDPVRIACINASVLIPYGIGVAVGRNQQKRATVRVASGEHEG